jgi:hypothetical protein
MSESNSFSPNYLLLIERLKAEKNDLINENRQLREQCNDLQNTAYKKVLEFNAEVANKFFKDMNNEINFSSRISSSCVLMVSFYFRFA